MRSLKQPFLMVDDSHTDIIIAKKCYEKSGLSYPFKSFTDGRSLISYLESLEEGDGENMPFVVLLDLNMPVMDGLETLKRVRSNQRYAKPPPPICIFTNSNDRDDKRREFDLGADSFQTKPSLVQDYIDFFKSLVKNLETSLDSELQQ